MTLLIYILFACSGFIGLVYESVWSRYLKLFLGHSSYGQILTLTIYMGGLGAGAFLAGRYLKRVRRPFFTYAMVELLVGLGALAYHPVYLYATEAFYASPAVAGMPQFAANVCKVVLSVLITGPLATLLGATFPILAIGVMRLTKDAGKASLPKCILIKHPSTFITKTSKKKSMTF